MLMRDSETDTPLEVQRFNESHPNEMSVGVITNLPNPVLRSMHLTDRGEAET